MTASSNASAIEQGVGPSPILLVDDRPANLLALEAILNQLGQPLVMARSGEEALRRLLDGEYAVVLMDVQMPGMDGFQTVRYIRERQKTRFVPVIFITAISRDAENMLKGYSEGAVDYITKPFDPDILRSKVKVFIQLHQQRQVIRRQEELLRERELESERQRNEARIRSVTEAMPLGMLAVGPDGRIQWANRRWREWTGLLPGEEIPASDSRFFHPEDRASALEAWHLALTQDASCELSVRIRSRGDFRWCDYRVVPDIDPLGNRVGFIVAAVDVHQRRKAEEERSEALRKERAAREAAEEANRSKDEFLATVSHELRTPLNAILGWVRLLRGGMLDEAKASRALETIERNARVQSELVEDILDVSRIVTGKLRLQAQNFKLSAVVNSALETVRPSALARDVAVQAGFDVPDRVVTGDPDRLQQVVWNLLSNAIKFTPAGGHVTIETRGSSSGVEIVVSDDGNGINPEFLPFVFERFRQADGTTTRAQGGLGLGLAIVRHIVELHGGTITAESAGAGKGSTFTVRLPVRALRVNGTSQDALAPSSARPFELPRTQAPAPLPSVEGLRVLIVDDQQDARDLVTELFRQHGAAVKEASSAEDALRHVIEDPPEVIVSDIGMPGSDGYGLIRRIRELPADRGGRVPAIALTGFARAEDSRLALEAGFQVHLTKPVEPTEVVALVASLAGR